MVITVYVDNLLGKSVSHAKAARAEPTARGAPVRLVKSANDHPLSSPHTSSYTSPSVLV